MRSSDKFHAGLHADSDSLKACIECLCNRTQSCSEINCNSGGGCGPYQLSLGFWQDAYRPTVEGDGSSANETTAFQNCANHRPCANTAVERYAGRYNQTCGRNGTFSCESLTRLFALGPVGCTTSEGVPRIETVELCYSEKVLASAKNENVGLISGLVGGGVVVLVGVILAIIIVKRRKCGVEDENGTEFRVLRSSTGNTFAKRGINLPVELVIPPDELRIDTSKPLGEGQFGMVYQGYYNYKKIAAKKPKLGHNNNAIFEFKKELELLASVGSHRNIVRFYGAEISQIRRGIAYVILEFSPNGNLVDHMRNHHTYPKQMNDSEAVTAKSDTDSSGQLADPSAYSTKIHWVEQIAAGMEFLEQNRVLHGDMAARNVLLFSNNKVKISDFGFARNLKNYDEYEKKEGPLPWRWMALESLERRIFSSKSDVWAFGVTVWEIFTAGIIPYIGQEKFTNEFSQSLKDGKRLPQPASAPDEIYETMLSCWQLAPEDRPTFATLVQYFHIQRMSVCGTFIEDDYEQVVCKEEFSSTITDQVK